MATYSKYKLYELYETDDGINWFPMGEYKAVLSEMYSEDCGYSARTITETVDDCSGTTKVITTITKHQESYNSGETWVTTSSSSSVTYEENSPDCALPIDYSQEYFTTIARNNGTIVFSGNSTTQDVLAYSKNGDTWRTSRVIRVDVKSGDVVRWRGTWGSQSQNTGKIGQFSGTSSFDVQGNIMSLIYGDNYTGKTSLSDKSNKFNSLLSSSNVVNAENLILPATTLASSAYTAMFKNCTSLTTAPQLPATTFDGINRCYYQMFEGCTSLTTAPELPATTLVNSCYYRMFYGCTALRTAPQLPATTLANYCYASMFSGCISLTQAPELPATTLANKCYQGMFQFCTSLTTAPQLLATTLADSCCYGMFSGCTSLTAAPELQATTLVSNCYYNMFFGCTKLNYIKAMFTTKPSALYTLNWVSGVSSSGTFVKNSAATWDVTGADGIPSGWSVQNA